MNETLSPEARLPQVNAGGPSRLLQAQIRPTTPPPCRQYVLHPTNQPTSHDHPPNHAASPSQQPHPTRPNRANEATALLPLPAELPAPSSTPPDQRATTASTAPKPSQPSTATSTTSWPFISVLAACSRIPHIKRASQAPPFPHMAQAFARRLTPHKDLDRKRAPMSRTCRL